MTSWDCWIICGLLLLACVASFMLTGFLRRYALIINLMDTPNDRSSHTTPTPRGGGVAIVLVLLIFSLLFWRLDLLTFNELWIVLGAGGMVALVGWIDDHAHVAARWRLFVHFVAAIWAVMLLGGLPNIITFRELVGLGFIGDAFAVIYLVWMLNLYNFMDGIDGIAGIEAVTVCLGEGIILLLSPVEGNPWVLPMLLLFAVLGFLCWNFPKAKIFMGDAGSGFIGIVLGIFSLQSAWLMPDLFWGWVILLGAFIVDATVTLVRRLLRGQSLSVAHRSHAYQYASRKYDSHVKVTIFFGVINIFWLLPIAIFVVKGWLDGVNGTLVAYLPLVLLAIYFKAGASERQEI